MKSIGISERTHKEVISICKSLEIRIGEFVHYSAHYFKKTGIDPSKPDSESPYKVVKEMERRIGQVISYIKTHESDKLNPLLEQLMMLVRRSEIMLNDAPKESSFKDVLKRMEEMMEADQKHHLEQLKTQHKYYKEQLEHLQKSYEQTNANSIKKMDEVISRLDKMAATLNGLHIK